MAVVENAILFDENSRGVLSAKIQELTALENPNSVQQMKQWLSENGLETDTLGKKAVSELLKAVPQTTDKNQLADCRCYWFYCICSCVRTRGTYGLYRYG